MNFRLATVASDLIATLSMSQSTLIENVQILCVCHGFVAKLNNNRAKPVEIECNR
jgi:hypothetical protein